MDEETFKRAQVSKGGRETKLEWVRDSSFRFYPAEADDELGYRLNYWDAATNKVLAAVFRNVIRDYIDLLEIHQTRLSLGALIWAAAGKDDGLSPLFMIEELVRIHRYPAIAYDEVTLTRPFDRKEAKQVWLQALHGREVRPPSTSSGPCLRLALRGPLRPIEREPAETAAPPERSMSFRITEAVGAVFAQGLRPAKPASLPMNLGIIFSCV
jgi:hypothetical protein